MSRRLLVGSSAGVGAAALALVLALPTAALAHEKDADDGAHGKSAQAKSQHAKSHDSTQAEAAQPDGDGSDPAGNNGTIKIDYAAPADSGHANRPHPGCAFQLRVFGFDDDQYGDITFVGQAPTNLGTLLTQTHVLLSSDAAGGGQDVDEVYSYTAQQLGLTSQQQAKQGWHVKVSVDADNAPGGAKQKVFWLKCEQTPAGSNTTLTPSPTTTSGTATQGGSTVTTKSVDTTSTTAETASKVTAAGAVSAAAQSAPDTAFTGGEASAATAPAPTATTRGSALPFTGFGLATMLLIALAAVLAGGFAIRAGRRRTAARF